MQCEQVCLFNIKYSHIYIYIYIYIYFTMLQKHYLMLIMKLLKEFSIQLDLINIFIIDEEDVFAITGD